jgi:autotransporter-associated beta strand protein
MKIKLTNLWLLAGLLAGLSVTHCATAATVVWSGYDATNNVNTNWSDSLNWSGVTPAAANSVFFYDAGGVVTVSNINNIVDGNTTILTLQYGNTNSYHTTLINPGVTLTVSNNAAGNLFTVGTLTDNGVSQIVDATVTGSGGNLVVVSTNVGSYMEIQQGASGGGSHTAVLDLSGLDNFNLTAGRLFVAANYASGGGASNYLAGTLTLAKTNFIQLNGTTTPTLDIGDAVSNPNTITTNLLQLGQTNALFIDTIVIGRTKQNGTVKFNPAFTGSNPALYLRGKSATRVGTLAIGDYSNQVGNPGSLSASTGTLDLSLGTVDAQVNLCFVGRGQVSTNAGGATGTLTLNAGTFNVNTLNLATVIGSNNIASANVTGTVNVLGTATLAVNGNLTLGTNPNTNSLYFAKVATGTLNITNGTVYANAITSVSTNGVISTINVNNGTLCITNTAGTPSLPLAALNLTSASLHLNANPALTNIVVTNVTGTATITIDSIGYPGGTVTYPLISYAGTDPYSSLTLASLGAYTGSLVDNSSNKRIDLQITAGPTTPILGSIVWGGGVNNHWDTSSLNWTNAGITTVYADTDLVNFNDLGKTGSVNLVATVSPGGVTVSNVAVNYTISGPGSISGAGGLTKGGVGALTLSTTNSYTGSTVINAGTVTTTVAGALPAATIVNFSAATNATLNLQGTAQTLAGMTFGNGNSNAANAITLTGTSGSALTVSPATLTLAPANATNNLALNMAGLSSFNYNNSSGTITENNGTAQQTSTGQTTVTLAGGTNTITAATLNVGNGSTSSGVVNSTLNLGTNNTLNAGTINIGSGRADGTVQFAGGVANGTLTVAGATGGSSTATLVFGGHDSFQASDKPVDLFDTTAGTLNAQFGSMTIGVVSPTANMTSSRGITPTASFKMGAGTLTASSLTLGMINSASGDTGSFNYSITNIAVFSITNGGTANITTLNVTSNNYSGNLNSGSVLSATVSLTNGATLNAANIQKGPIATPAAGSLNVTAQLQWGDATLGNIPGGNLTVNGVAVVLAGAANNHIVNITSGQTGQINAWISGTGTLTDVGAGALILNGQNSFNGSLVMAGTNTLTLASVNTYTGNTVVSNGTLLVSGAGSLTSPNIIVQSNALFDVAGVTGGYTLGSSQSIVGNGSVNGSVTANSGAQIIPGGTGAAGTLTFSNNLTLNGQFITFDLSPNPASGNDLVNVGGTVTLNANLTIAVNQWSGPLSAGTYTLMNYSSLVTNTYNLVLIGPRNWTLNAGANALTLTVGVGGSANLTWVGDGTANNWDVQNTTNWVNAGNLDSFYTLDNITFNNTGSASPAVNLTTTLFPGSVTVNGAQSYTFGGSGQFAGPMALTNTGTGTLTLNTSNTFAGGTVINNGTVQLTFDNGTASGPESAAGTGPITDNGTLSITNNGGAPGYMTVSNIITGAGTINLPQNQEISFTGPGSMSGFTGSINIPASMTTTAKGDIRGSTVNLNASAIINVASGGTLWVAGSGVTVPATVNLVGTGNGENWGALRVDTGANFSGPVKLQGNAAIGAQNTPSGTISGVISDNNNGYSLTKLGAATSILTGANTYSGGTTISSGTLQIGNGLINGTLPGSVDDEATLTFAVATNTSQTYSGLISGAGALVENGYGGTLSLNNENTFTGNVTITAGALWITNAGALGTGTKTVTASNGTAGHPELHLNGVSGNILLPSTIAFTTSWIGNPSSPGVLVNEAGNNEVDGNINLTSGGGGTGIVVNNGTLNLAGTLSPTTTLRNLQFSGAGNGTVSGVIADGGSPNLLTGVAVAGPGTWTFTGNNTYVTNTTVSGGKLLVNGQLSGGGTVIVQTNATLGGSGSIAGTVNLQNGGIIQGGDGSYTSTLTVPTLNLGLASTNLTYSRFTVAAGGTIAATTLNVTGTNLVQILDSSLTVGTNTLFTYSSAISGFAGFQLGALPAGVAAQLLNTGSAVQLAVTSVTAVNTNSPVLTNSVSGRTLTLAWPADHLGWRLQVQTNALTAGLGTNWSTWPNSTNVTSVPIPLNPANPTVFFRLIYP